jgi:hypothetical protein
MKEEILSMCNNNGGGMGPMQFYLPILIPIDQFYS